MRARAILSQGSGAITLAGGMAENITNPVPTNLVAGGDAEEVLQVAAAWLRAGHDVALATVVRTWGSSPRPAGSQLAVRTDGAFVGSVSGGCVEGAVVEEALAVIAGGAPRVLSFGVADETAWSVGLACGGKIQIYVERME